MMKLILALLFLQAVFTINHSCMHHEIEHQTVKSQVSHSQRRFLQGQEWEPMRVTFDFSELENLPADKKAFEGILKKQASISQQFIYNNLLTKRNIGNNMFPADGELCYKKRVSQSDKTFGIENSDLHIYLTITNEPTKSYIAYATPCAERGEDDKPIFGLVNFNVGYLNQQTLKENDYFEYLNEIAFHELTHVLGFSSYTMKNWVNQETGQKYENPVINIKDKQGNDVPWLTTPRVKEVAQKHYNCTEMIGMKLENQGGSGSKGSHWEKVLLENEYMTPSVIAHDALYSNFTLALLEDSGWYKPTYKNVDPVIWGKNKGCTFIEKCSPKLFEEFQPQQVQVCNYHHNSVAKVSVVDRFGDNCMIPASTGRVCIDSSVYQWIPQEQSGEEYGQNSACFQSNIQSVTPRPFQKQVVDNYLKEQRCLKHSCDANGNIFVYVSGEKYLIDKKSNKADIQPKGKNKQIAGFVNGPPDHHAFCFTYPKPCPNFCSRNGYCMGKKCHCVKDFAGEDCSIPCKNNNYVHKGKCLENQQCPEGTQIDEFTKICTETPKKTCLQSQVNHKNQCLDNCPLKYYEDSNKYCQNCSENCNTCVNQFNCQDCEQGYFIFNNKCVQVCPEGYFANKQDNICQKCTNGCKTCQNGYSCEKCADDYIKKEGTDICILSCDEHCNICENNHMCKECKEDTFSFIDEETKVMRCLERCPQGYYKDENNTCSKCGDFCKACSAKDFCILCEENSVSYVQDADKVYCLQSCPQGYKLNEDKKCVACKDENCMKCSNNNDQKPFYKDGDCYSECSDGYYPNDEKICKECSKNCQKCENGKQCQVCKKGYKLNEKLKICEQESPCLVDGCKKCTQNLKYCYQCQENRVSFTHNQNLLQCPEVCPDGHYNSNGECKECHKSCKTCKDYYQCSECADPSSKKYFTQGNFHFCLDTCPVKSEYDEETKTCVKCKDDEKYYFDGKCHEECPEDMDSKFQICQFECEGEGPCQSSKLCGPGKYQLQEGGLVLCYEQCPMNREPTNGYC